MNSDQTASASTDNTCLLQTFHSVDCVPGDTERERDTETQRERERDRDREIETER